MALDSLAHLYVKELQDLYSAEKQLVRALPRMVKAAQSGELKHTLKTHLEQTHEHVRRLEQILSELGVEAEPRKCKGMEGLIKEAKDLLKQEGVSAVLDAALISAAQKIEHYEISGYGSVRTYARMLLYEDAAEWLQQTLNEEGQADELLAELAEATMSIESDSTRLDDIQPPGPAGLADAPGSAGRQGPDIPRGPDPVSQDTARYQGATEGQAGGGTAASGVENINEPHFPRPAGADEPAGRP